MNTLTWQHVENLFAELDSLIAGIREDDQLIQQQEAELAAKEDHLTALINTVLSNAEQETATVAA